MDLNRLQKVLILLAHRTSGRHARPRRGYASEDLMRDMDDKVREQVVNVATLPGIVTAAYGNARRPLGLRLPDRPGGIDPEAGVVSGGGVGFDISCGVRTLHTGLQRADIMAVQQELADLLYERIPAGLGSTGTIRLSISRLSKVLRRGAAWAIDNGYGTAADLTRT